MPVRAGVDEAWEAGDTVISEPGMCVKGEAKASAAT
jgi:hypothetical protein